MSSILSIIIPTKNRYKTLLGVIDSLLLIPSDQLEIVVQDNSDENSTILEYINRVDDKRIKYYHSTDRLSQTGNSDLAVKNATGEYICFIGDDDGVMPYIVDVVDFMIANKIEILKCYKPGYYWPQMQTTSTSSDVTGVLKYSDFKYKIKKLSTKASLKKVLDMGGSNMGDLPCLYHGIVKRTVLDKVYNASNSYFPGPSPDMANAVGLCLFEDYYYYVDFPVVISGKSIHSIGGQGILHNHINRIEDVPHLPKDTALQWSKEIPRYWTGSTIWAESLLKSLERCGFESRKKELNLPYLNASLILFHSNLKKVIFGNDFSGRIYSLGFFYSYCKLFYNRGVVFLKNRVSFLGLQRHADVPSISAAIHILLKKIDYSKLPFKVHQGK